MKENKHYPLCAYLICTILTLFIGIYTFLTYKPILDFHFFNDDWPLLWGVKNHNGFPYNPYSVIWNFFQSGFVIRVGVLQIWLTALLIKFFGLNPYYYHLFSIILKTFSVFILSALTFKISRNIYASAVAGVVFGLSFLGMYSAIWYIHNSVYILSILTLVIIFLISRTHTNSYKSLFLVGALTALSIFLYSPRAHGLLAIPFIYLIFSSKPLNIRSLANAAILIIIIFLSFRLFFPDSASQESLKTISRLRGAFTSIDRGAMHMTYPANVLAYTFLPKDLADQMANLLSNPVRIFSKVYLTNFRLWLFIIFPTIWTFGAYVLLKAKKHKKISVFFAILGYAWIILNVFLRRSLFQINWDWNFQFTFILSGLLVIYSTSLYVLYRGSPIYSNLVKLMIASGLLVFSSYFINWGFDPFFPPTHFEFSRYLTMSGFFGAIFIGSFMATILHLTLETFDKRYYRLTTLLFGAFTIIFLSQIFIRNTKHAQYYLNTVLRPYRSIDTVDYFIDSIISSVDIVNNSTILVFSLNDWDIMEAQGAIFTGHGLALATGISDPERFPIVYFTTDKAAYDIDEYCSYIDKGFNAVHLFYKNRKLISKDEKMLPSCMKSQPSQKQ